MQPKKIRIPVLIPNDYHAVKIVCSKSRILASGSMIVHCKKQIIKDVEIKCHFEFVVPEHSYFLPAQPNSESIVKIKGWKLNQILRMLYLNNLKNPQ